MYTVIVTESLDIGLDSPTTEIRRYRVESLDLLALAVLIERKPRAPRADKGKSRKGTEAA